METGKIKLKDLPDLLVKFFGKRNLRINDWSDPANQPTFGTTFIRSNGSIVNHDSADTTALNSVFHEPFAGPYFNLTVDGMSLWFTKPIKFYDWKNITIRSQTDNGYVTSHPITVRSGFKKLQGFATVYSIKWYDVDNQGNPMAFDDLTSYVTWAKSQPEITDEYLQSLKKEYEQGGGTS